LQRIQTTKIPFLIHTQKQTHTYWRMNTSVMQTLNQMTAQDIHFIHSANKFNALRHALSSEMKRTLFPKCYSSSSHMQGMTSPLTLSVQPLPRIPNVSCFCMNSCKLCLTQLYVPGWNIIIWGKFG